MNSERSQDTKSMYKNLSGRFINEIFSKEEMASWKRTSLEYFQ